jgi:hypothetical protein
MIAQLFQGIVSDGRTYALSVCSIGSSAGKQEPYLTLSEPDPACWVLNSLFATTWVAEVKVWRQMRCGRR